MWLMLRLRRSALGFIVILRQLILLLIHLAVLCSIDHPISRQGLRIAEAEKEISRYKTRRNMIIHLPCSPSPAMSTSIASQRLRVAKTKLIVSFMISMAGAETSGSNTVTEHGNYTRGCRPASQNLDRE